MSNTVSNTVNSNGQSFNLKRIGGSNAQVWSFKDNEILISYQTIVAARIGNKFYKTDKFWNVTTSKHVNRFFNDLAYNGPFKAFNVLKMDQGFFDTMVSLTVNPNLKPVELKRLEEV